MDIRPWDDADVDWWVALRREWQPTIGEAQLRALASGRVARYVHRAVAWESEQRLGFATIAFPPGEDMAAAQVLVASEHRGRGVGSRLWADLLGSGEAGDLIAWFPDDAVLSRQVAEHWGFEVVSHAITSRLDLRATDRRPAVPEPFTVRIVEASEDEASKAGLETVLAGSETNPEATELGWRHTVADLERMFSPMLWVLVEENGAPVAMAGAQEQGDEPWLVIYTGVLPDHRRRGLARVAKEQLHAEAARRGARELLTDNEARNDGILALNRALGYERTGGEVRLLRKAPPPLAGIC